MQESNNHKIILQQKFLLKFNLKLKELQRIFSPPVITHSRFLFYKFQVFFKCGIFASLTLTRFDMANSIVLSHGKEPHFVCLSIPCCLMCNFLFEKRHSYKPSTFSTWPVAEILCFLSFPDWWFLIYLDFPYIYSQTKRVRLFHKYYKKSRTYSWAAKRNISRNSTHPRGTAKADTEVTPCRWSSHSAPVVGDAPTQQCPSRQ